MKQGKPCVSAGRTFTNTTKRGQDRRTDTRGSVGTSETSKRHAELVVGDVLQVQHRLDGRGGGPRRRLGCRALPQPTVLQDLSDDSASEEVSIPREHLLEGRPVSDVCDRNRINSNLFYRWQREFFEGGHVVFERRGSEPVARQAAKEIDELERKLQQKDSGLGSDCGIVLTTGSSAWARGGAIRRRTMRPTAVLQALFVGAAVAVLAAPPPAGQDRPNIIFFLVDDYDKPETSVYGGSVLTPNLDRLAREGMTFHNAYMTSTVCTPSRYTCLTGRYAGSSYSQAYLSEFPEGTQGLPAFNVALEDDRMNVGRVLAANGYATGFVGKYHVGGEESHSPEQLFENPAANVRDYVYAEMGASRAVRTEDWSYMALRFTRDQVEEMREHKRLLEKTLTGLSGGISRGRGNPESMNYDQLYNIAVNPEETRNLAHNPEYAGKLREMQQLLVQELRRFPNRPYGEFIPGGNAMPAGSYNDILETMRNYMARFGGDVKKERKAKKGK